MKKPAYTLIDKPPQSRLSLNEGRRQGLGYGFCINDNGVLTTAMPITACKDYLSDVVWSEATGKSSEFYNFMSSPRGCFKDGNGYLAMTILPFKASRGFNEYRAMASEIAVLAKNYPKMQGCVNWFEKGVGLNEFTVIEPMADGFFVAIVPAYWLACPALISLYSFLLRISMWGFDAKDPIESIKNSAKSLPADDSYYLNDILPKMERMLKGEKLVQDMPSRNFCPHSAGIVNFLFKK